MRACGAFCGFGVLVVVFFSGALWSRCDPKMVLWVGLVALKCVFMGLFVMGVVHFGLWHVGCFVWATDFYHFF